VRAQHRPEVTGSAARLEDVPEQLYADLDHPALDADGDLGGGVRGVLKVVLQIPADVFLVLRGELEGELLGGGD